MRYLRALQRQSDKRWDFTCTHDGIAYPIGYCSGNKPLDKNEHPELYHTDGHATVGEARQCYANYLADKCVRISKDEYHLRCQKCGSLTKFRVSFAGLISKNIILCHKHCKPKFIKEVLVINEIWTS